MKFVRRTIAKREKKGKEHASSPLALHLSHVGSCNMNIYFLSLSLERSSVTPPVPGVVAATVTTPRTGHVSNISTTYSSDVIRRDNAKTVRL